MKEEKSRIETTNAEDIKMILRLTETCAEYAFQSIENAKDLVGMIFDVNSRLLSKAKKAPQLKKLLSDHGIDAALQNSIQDNFLIDISPLFGFLMRLPQKYSNAESEYQQKGRS